MDQENRILLNHAYDAVKKSESYNKPQFIGFLNEHESLFLKDNISNKHNVLFYGGYEGAVRVMMGVGCEKNDFPITAVRFDYNSDVSKLSHSDFLGALMSLGINRNTVGDIAMFDDFSVVFLKNDILNFVVSQLDKVKNVKVIPSVCDISSLQFADNFDIYNFTVSSLRLDVFVSSICNLSRDKASKLIKSDMVAINHKIENSVSKNIAVGNTVTIRKFGKFVFSEIKGLSQKGKYKISVKRFR